MNPAPALISSNKAFLWTIPEKMSGDYFDFQREGSGSLLLIGMHVSDELPWICARNPLHFPREPGLIDVESKRILGKRYRVSGEGIDSKESQILDTIPLVLGKLQNAGHSFEADDPSFPELEKKPGKLIPRKLAAEAKISAQGREFTLRSRNFSEISQCLHAELTLIFRLGQILSETSIDVLDGFHLQTTLKPCRMCASFLHVLRGKCRSFRVAYSEDDPGPLAANTLLDRFGYQT